jgi:hypothetical protein
MASVGIKASQLPLRPGRAAKAGRTGLRREIPRQFFTDFCNEICTRRSSALPPRPRPDSGGSSDAPGGPWNPLPVAEPGRVGMWRGGFRLNVSVAAPFVWRCLNGSTVTPFPHPAHRTGRAGLPHPALGQDLTPSPTARRAQAGIGVRARNARKGARVDKSRPCVA